MVADDGSDDSGNPPAGGELTKDLLYAAIGALLVVTAYAARQPVLCGRTLLLARDC